ncbi:Glutamate--tRNA ligase, partial [Metamycoplasma alkalescens]
METYKQSASTINEIKNNLLIYENPKKDTDLKINNLEVVKTFLEFLKNVDFTIENIQKCIELTKQKLNLKGKDLFMPIRIATTYEEHGPELAKAIYLFGKEIVFERLSKW